MQSHVYAGFVANALEYRGPRIKARYIVNAFHNDTIPMLIFSYLWTSDQASKKIKELNSKSNDIIVSNFVQDFEQLYISYEKTKPMPINDIEFDDFKEL
jgi:hypothetical protein